jgi:putative endonuclease
MQKQCAVYIATNQRHTVLYTGVTSNLFQREWQHREKADKNSFTSKYNINKIVYYEH